jgi:methyl-accepting chemotaxis protein
MLVGEMVSVGEPTSSITVDTHDKTGKLMSALTTMNDSLVEIVGQTRSAANTISAA